MRRLIEEMEASTDAGALFLYRDGATNNGSFISRLHIGNNPDQRTVRRLLKTGGAFVVQFEHAPQLTDQLGMSRIGMISKAVSEELNTPVTSHLYVKGPGVSALPLHSDSTDTFVYQLAGCNRWRICTPHAYPTNGTKAPSESERAERLLIEHGGNPSFGGKWKGSSRVEDHTKCAYHTATEGDVIYLPRGVLHAAKAVSCDRASPDEPVVGLMPGLSVHLTIGIHRKMSEWVHLLDSVGTILKSSSSGVVHCKEDLDDLIAYSRTLPSWRRQMPTWALREGRLDEVIRELGGKLELLRPRLETSKRYHAEASSSALLRSLQDPAVLHAAILVWQQQVDGDYEAHLLKNEAKFRTEHTIGRRLNCGPDDVCPAGYSGQVNPYGCDSSCDESCDYFWTSDCDNSCDYCDECGSCTL